MKTWNGIEDNSTDLWEEGHPLNTVENMSYFTGGELGRRPGFGAKISNTGLVCGELNGYVIFIKANGNIESESQ